MTPEEQLIRFITPDGNLQFDRIILHLGGRFDRILTTLALARQYPDALVIISSEYDPKTIRAMWEEHGLKNIVFDYDAWDTVTNFTKTRWYVELFKPTTLHVVTDQYHMVRAIAIAKWVYRNEDLTVVEAVHTTEELGRVEPKSQVCKDEFRSAVYHYSRYVVSEGLVLYNPLIKRKRMPTIRAMEKELQ